MNEEQVAVTTNVPAPLKTKPMPANGPQGVVVRAMGEFVQGVWAPYSREVQPHAYVTPSGVVVRQTPTNRYGVHAAGFSRHLGVVVLVPGRVDRLSELYRRIAVDDWATPEQWITTVNLVEHWCRFYGLHIQSVRRHSDVDLENKRGPGKGFMWTSFQQALSERLRPLRPDLVET